MSYQHVIVFVAIAATVAAADAKPPSSAPPAVAEAKRILRGGMIDPASTQFRSVRQISAPIDGQPQRFVCGEYNSRNRMGGYAGYSAFVFVTSLKTVMTGRGFLFKSDGTSIELGSDDDNDTEPTYSPNATPEEARDQFQSWFNKKMSSMDAVNHQLADVKKYLSVCR